ncbi:PEP-CTERM sorting domain-containing protein [Roseateles sp. LYH14W]|uniref:PEP-CTERM sorting domain-containing protein n=1 Tax=Pelomonas parva TaxID=3299032 RepID=A0ABW7F4N6_9BURK
MSIQVKSAVAIGLLGLAAAAQATTAGVTVTGNTAGVTNAAFAADGFTPADFTDWQTNAGWWNGFGETITFKLDQSYHLSSATVTLDWNDVYRFYASTDGVSYTTLFTVSGLFDQSTVNSGQVTLPVTFAQTALAYQYVRVQALYGDGFNSVGEVSFSGTAAAVPEPTSLALMLGGIGIVGFVARRRIGR